MSGAIRKVLRRLCVASACALALLIATPAVAAQGPHVYILLVDGLDATLANEQLMPTLWRLAHGGQDRATFYPQAHAVMPTVTNTNHASVMTGAYAEAHGIVGNWLWDRTPAPPTGSEQARNLEVETLFTVIESERPALRTAALFGKSRLVGLFNEVPGRQKRPDVLWGDGATETEPIDARAGFATDERTMNEVLRTISVQDPDLMFAALPAFDLTAHVFGPESNEARRAVLEADREIGRLVDFLKRRGTWGQTILIITADHGFQSVRPDATRRYPLVFFGRELQRAGVDGVQPLGSGAVEFLQLPGAVPQALNAADAERLKQVRALALAQPEIAEAWYRLPNPADGGDAFTLARSHPEWRIDHPRAGELVLLARPHYAFADPFSPRIAGLAGDHGGPDEGLIPILITGGDPRIRSQIVAADGSIPQAENPDIGITAAWLLGVRAPRTITHKPVPPRLSGRVLREAFE